MSMNASGLVIQLQKFEGPLALLLYLIRKEEMDILDINIHEITKQYLDYIKLMKEFDLEVAGEFIAMASTLIHIKSRLLLPQYNDQGEVIDVEDPRKELVQKLMEYQKYQEAAKALYERPLVGRDLWLRGIRETLEPKNDEILLEENALFSLISSYRKMVRTAQKKIHKVSSKLQSIASRIVELKDKIKLTSQITLRELIDSADDRVRQTLITFLSLLELGKLGYVSVYQNEVYGDIYIQGKKTIEHDAISRVEEYDSIHAEDTASALFKVDEVKELIQDQGFDFTEDENPGQTLVSHISSFEAEDLHLEVASDEEILAAELSLDETQQNGDNVT
jgi:segregation and condensation protein A